jgi:hypothetical protein
MTHSYDFPPKPQEKPARPEKSPCTARPSEMPVCSQTQKETHVDLDMMARAKQYLKASVQPGEWRKQCFLRFLVRGIRTKQVNTIFRTIF